MRYAAKRSSLMWQGIQYNFLCNRRSVIKPLNNNYFILFYFIPLLTVMAFLVFVVLYSGWSQCSGEEIERVQREWRVKQEKGITHEFFEERRQLINRIGETTTIVGRKGQCLTGKTF